MKKFYETILAELTEFNADEVIMASPTVDTGDGDNYLGDLSDLKGIGSIGDL